MAVAHATDMLSTTGRALEELFAASSAGDIPDGRGQGVAIFAPGTVLSRPFALLVRLLMWQGKVFDRERGELRNLLSPFSVRSIRAAVYRDASVFDGREAIILDYSKSWIARWVRDEIREVAPGVYLGLVFLFRLKVLKFALTFPVAGAPR